MYKLHFAFILVLTLISVVYHTYAKCHHEKRHSKRVADTYEAI